MKEKNNNSKIVLISVLVIGIIIIGIMYILDSKDKPVTEEKNIASQSGKNDFDELDNKVNKLKSGLLNEGRFKDLERLVDSYLNEEVITQQVANDLKEKITKILTDRVYKQCELALNNANCNDPQIKQLLKSLENKIGLNPTIYNYKRQIERCEYYSVKLPNEIEDFVQSGQENYEEGRYVQFMDEVQNMNGLDNKYKNSPKFIKIKKGLIDDKLKKFKDKHKD